MERETILTRAPTSDTVPADIAVPKDVLPDKRKVLQRVKQLGYDSAIIVKGKITVQYP